MDGFEEEFARKISSVRTVEGLQSEFLKYMTNVGMQHFCYQIIRHNFHRNLQNYYVTNYPKDWENRYLEQDYFKDDPLVHKYTSYIKPFTWGHEPSDNKRASQMFSECSEFGLGRGIGIPIPGPANSFSVLTLASDEQRVNEIGKINHYKGGNLMIAALLLHSAIISLNLENAMHNQHELTNKEAECLKWICGGKSYSEIGTILGTSESSIKKRVANIYFKLGVSTRHEAILKVFKYKIVEA